MHCINQPNQSEIMIAMQMADKNMIDFHDREMSIFGVHWLEKKMNEYSGTFCTVRDYFNK